MISQIFLALENYSYVGEIKGFSNAKTVVIFKDTCNLSYLGFWCQIESIMNSDLKMKMGKSGWPESPCWVGILFGYMQPIVSGNPVSNRNSKK